MRNTTLLLFILGLFLINPAIKGQSYLYFQDSPDPVLYDFSWMEVTPPSELERTGSELRKFPVESDMEAAQGLNSLRLHWRSVSGGSWLAISAGLNWTEKNLTDTDTLHFLVRSQEGLNSNQYITIFMEDVQNRKTSFHSLQSYFGDLPPGVWKRITIPMEVFLEAGDAVDFTKIKTVGFRQGAADGQSHTLFIDDVRVFKGSGFSPITSVPQGVRAKGYDSHIEILWNKNPETNLNGYQVRGSIDQGETYHVIGLVPANDTGFIHWIQSPDYSISYQVASLNQSNQISEYSNQVEATTREFNDDEFLDMVQEYTFRYFWDFAHPVSGLARERNTSGDVVTSGGSGFGIMAILVGIERGFISREEAVARMLKITAFLAQADRFHGVWSHWLNGVTGDAIPFSEYDNGGDLVETSFLAQGLLTAREYFNRDDDNETEIRNRITQLWEEIEWDWYQRNNSNALYWHWSPNFGWQMNMPIKGWNEAAIAYILGVASPTHSIPGSLWKTGWARDYGTGGTYYGYKLDIGWAYGGPLFFAHYSFQGFDPRNLKDDYTNYFRLNRHHTLIHREYAIQNPKNHPGYGENAWGFTASDDPFGYQVHEPSGNRDNGTITPTAALSSMPYTPEESLNALKHFYRELGYKLWGRMGFFDAYNLRENWFANSYLAIDQGPIINMIENYRSALLWNNFMANEEIAPALTAIGFITDPHSITENLLVNSLKIYPNPVKNDTRLEYYSPEKGLTVISAITTTGLEIRITEFVTYSKGDQIFDLDTSGLKPGVYFLKVLCNQKLIGTSKLIVMD